MGPCVVLVGFSEGAKWDLGPIFQLPCGKVLAQVGPLNMVLLRSTWSAATMLYNNSSFWSWPVASISTTWVSLKSDTLAWVFNHAVWGPGAGSREKERRGDGDGEIDVKRRAESEKDCSGRGNRGLNSDEIIPFVSWQNRQTRDEQNRSPLATWCCFITDPILPTLLITKKTSVADHVSPLPLILYFMYRHIAPLDICSPTN